MGPHGVRTAVICLGFSMYAIVDDRNGLDPGVHVHKALMGAHVGFAVARVTRNAKTWVPFWLGLTPTACTILYVHNKYAI